MQLLRGESRELFQLALRRTDARGVHALVTEQILGDRPALALVVHEILDGHAYVVEEHLVDFVAAVHEDQRPYGDAGRFHVDEQKRDAILLALSTRRGAHETEDPVGHMCERGPRLLSVD